MQEGAMSFEKVAPTAAAIELSPGATAGMPVGRDIAQAEPAAIGTMEIGTEMLRSVDLAPAATGRDQRRGRGAGGVPGRGGALWPRPPGRVFAWDPQEVWALWAVGGG